MDSEAWKSLEERALWLLEHPDQTSPPATAAGMATLFRLWHYPSIGTHVSWSVNLSVRDHPAGMPLVRAVTWDRPADWRQMTAPLQALKLRSILKPSIRIEDAAISLDHLAPFMEAAGGLTMRISSADSPVVPGGDIFGIEGYRSMGHIRLKWSGRGPSEWIEIIEWVARFRSLLVQSIRERATEPAVRNRGGTSRGERMVDQHRERVRALLG